MSNWWDQSSGWAGWFHVQGGISFPGRCRFAGYRRRPLRRSSRLCSRSAPTIVSTAPGGISAAAGTPGSPSATCSAGPAPPSTSSRVTAIISICSRPHPTGGSCRRGGTLAPAGHHGSRFRAASRRPGRPSPRSRAIPFHLDLFTVGTDNRVYSCWWDERSGWHNWFAIGVLQSPLRRNGDRGRAFPRPARSVHHCRRRPDHVHLVECPQRLGQLVPGVWWRRFARLAGHGDCALLEPSRSVCHRHRQPDLQHVVA